MTKEQMMDKVIGRYGYEHIKTIWFCRAAEKLSEKQLKKVLKIIDKQL